MLPKHVRMDIHKTFDRLWKDNRQSNQTQLVQGYRKSLAPMSNDDVAFKFARDRALALRQPFKEKDAKDAKKELKEGNGDASKRN